jgi:hypothetical protein
MWYLDRPISNSGKLAQRILKMADQRGWPWGVETMFDPDGEIIDSGRIAITSDSVILDRASRWVNLSGPLIAGKVPDAWVIDLSV